MAIRRQKQHVGDEDTGERPAIPDPPDSIKGTTVEEADPAGVIPDDWAGAQVAGAEAGGVLLGGSSEEDVIGPSVGPRRSEP